MTTIIQGVALVIVSYWVGWLSAILDDDQNNIIPFPAAVTAAFVLYLVAKGLGLW
jgi:PhoPQ-activated pathogenicity-related protein